jgi:outer membrane receptor protein involved in Fe transport
MFGKKNNALRRTTAIGAVIAGVAAIGTPAAAQDQPATETASTADEEIIVTGSRIRRDPATAPTPLINVGREELLDSGEPNLIDYLADIPALTASVVPEDTTGAVLGATGLSLLDLRNLGNDRTLVLVDGRRHVGSGQGFPNVDVDTIPRLLINNVEIITGGASSIYGADAVAGVVNFILRKDFDGFEADASYAEVAEGGAGYHTRLSALWGKNALNGRINIYASLEYDASDEIFDRDLDVFAQSAAILNTDSDAAGVPDDGDFDNIAISGAVSLSRPRGGILTIAHPTAPSPASDPDVLAQACNPNTNPFSIACFQINPGFSFLFQPDGTAFEPNYGTFRDGNGAPRTTLIGGDGDPLWTFNDSRLPEAEAYRFQSGVTVEVVEGVEVFGELKYVEEHGLYNFQPAFFDIQIRQRTDPNETLGIVGPALNNLTLGLDNAFLDPSVRALILGNEYVPLNASGLPVASCPNAADDPPPCPDPRAQLRLFTADLGARPQDNTREMTRAVFGIRGEAETFAFLKNASWEIGYTYGVVEDENREFETVDAHRLGLSLDAVVDTLGEAGPAGQIVCQVQLLAARGVPIPDDALGGIMSPTDPRVTECIPSSPFGEGGMTPARDYVLFDQLTTNKDEQEDFLAFTSGELWDFWGAGPLGMALGYEWRKETFTGAFFPPDVPGIFFANLLDDFPSESFDVTEWFGELRVPILKDLPFAQSIEFSGAYRFSDYSTGFESETWSTQGSWQISQDVRVRGTYGRSIRAPALGDLFAPQSQTFLQLNDNCSAPVIAATADPVLRGRRIDNCAALGIPATYVDPNPTSTNSGFTGGNPNLEPEEADTWTASIALTPRFIPDLTLVFDYYDIDIDNVIQTLSLQQIMNNCVDGPSLNPSACALLTRDPTTFEVVNFLVGPVNFVRRQVRGLDFSGTYHIPLSDWFKSDIGSLDISARGSYLIQRKNFTNPTDPTAGTRIDSICTGGVCNNRVRVATRVTWDLDKIAFIWETDWQSAGELFDETVLLANPDDRPAELLDTGSFTQHDFAVRWDVTDQARLRFGVVNAFDEQPSIQSISPAVFDQFDLFGRRFFVGLTYRH